MAYDIFISYRRRGGFETAKHLYRVSFDIDTLRNGDFDTELLRRIDECRDFILILSEGALDRCVDPSAVASADWVRCELAYALEKNKNIVPIMLAGFTAFPDNLPDVELGGNATVAATTSARSSARTARSTTVTISTISTAV